LNLFAVPDTASSSQQLSPIDPNLGLEPPTALRYMTQFSITKGLELISKVFELAEKTQKNEKAFPSAEGSLTFVIGTELEVTCSPNEVGSVSRFPLTDSDDKPLSPNIHGEAGKQQGEIVTPPYSGRIVQELTDELKNVFQLIYESNQSCNIGSLPQPFSPDNPLTNLKSVRFAQFIHMMSQVALKRDITITIKSQNGANQEIKVNSTSIEGPNFKLSIPDGDLKDQKKVAKVFNVMADLFPRYTQDGPCLSFKEQNANTIPLLLNSSILLAPFDAVLGLNSPLLGKDKCPAYSGRLLMLASAIGSSNGDSHAFSSTCIFGKLSDIFKEMASKIRDEVYIPMLQPGLGWKVEIPDNYRRNPIALDLANAINWIGAAWDITGRVKNLDIEKIIQILELVKLNPEEAEKLAKEFVSELYYEKRPTDTQPTLHENVILAASSCLANTGLAKALSELIECGSVHINDSQINSFDQLYNALNSSYDVLKRQKDLTSVSVNGHNALLNAGIKVSTDDSGKITGINFSTNETVPLSESLESYKKLVTYGRMAATEAQFPDEDYYECIALLRQRIDGKEIKTSSDSSSTLRTGADGANFLFTHTYTYLLEHYPEQDQSFYQKSSEVIVSNMMADVFKKSVNEDLKYFFDWIQRHAQDLISGSSEFFNGYTGFINQ
jgi:hypothetical protein